MMKAEEADFDYLDIASDFLGQSTDVREDGRVDVNLDSRLARTLSRLVPPPTPTLPPAPPKYAQTESSVRLNIVIQVVGSRGDVQPFIALGCELRNYGHRVRIATHDIFHDFVHKSGLEFYPIGGNPAELMAYMVKNPGLIPSMKSLRAGDIQLKRQMISEMLQGCWKSCIQPDKVTNNPFVADAIIANPPSFAHVHCAQALGVPVHLMFTMPWTSTRDFPQPIANLQHAGTEPKIANYISYGIVDFLTWQGLGDVINSWRNTTLDLEPVPLTEGPGLLDTLEVPFTYCWSPALVPKPSEWGPHIDVCGFFFRKTPDYTPTQDLQDFLNQGSAPIYIGFGSIVIDDPAHMTRIILDAVQASGVRAIISRGWSKLGAEENENIMYLDDCPHELLFQHVAAVVHHGGAGTTACGLLNGRPTTIVPFFGDQPFWGNMVAAAGAGPKPIQHKSLTSRNLADAILFCLTPEAAIAAAEIAFQMKKEDGVKAAVQSFHNNLPGLEMRCELLHDQPAAWTYRKGKKDWKLSKLAVAWLSADSKLDSNAIKLYHSKPVLIAARRWDPVTATASASVKTISNMVDATVGIVKRPVEEFKRNQSTVERTPSPTETTSHVVESSNLRRVTERGTSIASIRSDRQSVVFAESGAVKNKKGLQIAGAMALASAGSFGKVFVSTSKGILIDIPFAMTEGFQSLPRYYDKDRNGESKPQVTDFQSGVVLAGKSFGGGVYEGFTDIFKYTWQGKKDEGPKGVAKGLGKGLVSFTAKVGGAFVGLVAYPGRGIERSIRGFVGGAVAKDIEDAKKKEGAWIAASGKYGDVDVKAMIARFGR